MPLPNASYCDVHFSSFPFRLFACKSTFVSLEAVCNTIPEIPDALGGQTSPCRENFIVFSQANGLQCIPKYKLQWFSRDEGFVSRDESLVSSDESLVSSLVSRETRQGVVTYF